MIEANISSQNKTSDFGNTLTDNDKDKEHFNHEFNKDNLLKMREMDKFEIKSKPVNNKENFLDIEEMDNARMLDRSDHVEPDNSNLDVKIKLKDNACQSLDSESISFHVNANVDIKDLALKKEKEK
eukprot:CAMPEP_0116890956 /NCGR_PEP_ID=MMETSP0467-20121206/1450_1 /TAXON_ID=283647 /ORGANISM="Mesodinium pulex, Strain SPMC105" /LENGTH=125 /DNA_ID=CAMNT_0004559145 /DNA_START=316 /DNA_END=693 /DNA_ORIENTATION=+